MPFFRTLWWIGHQFFGSNDAAWFVLVRIQGVWYAYPIPSGKALWRMHKGRRVFFGTREVGMRLEQLARGGAA